MGKETAITEEFAKKLALVSRSAKLRLILQVQLALTLAGQIRLEIAFSLWTKGC